MSQHAILGYLSIACIKVVRPASRLGWKADIAMYGLLGSPGVACGDDQLFTD